MRNPKNNHRYVQVLVASRELFWKHGLKRVTVEDICREAGVSKMTFYKFFPNKVTLAKAVYDKEVETGYEKFKSIMENENASPLEKMEEMLLLKPEGIFMFLSKFFDILNDEKFIELYGSPQELVMELARFFIYGIMPREVGCKK